MVDAGERLLRYPLAQVMRRAISARGITQTEAAGVMGFVQPDVSMLCRGKVKGFSVDRLLLAIMALGHDVEISIHVTDHRVAGSVSVRYEDKQVRSGQRRRDASDRS